MRQQQGNVRGKQRTTDAQIRFNWEKDNPDTDATRISEMISFDRTTIGHVRGRLEAKKLITRRDGVRDKRTKLIRLTPKGQAVVRDVAKRVDKIAGTIFEPLNKSERAAILALLKKFAVPSGARANGDVLSTARK